MNDEGEVREARPSRRAVLAVGGLLAALTASVGLGAAAVARAAEKQPRASPPAPPVAAPASTPPSPRLGAPVAGIALQVPDTWTFQSFVLLVETGEWFTTQAKAGTNGLLDPAGLEVGEVVVSRLASDGTLLDSMVLPDSGHGIGLVMRVEAGARIVYSCWFAPSRVAACTTWCRSLTPTGSQLGVPRARPSSSIGTAMRPWSSVSRPVAGPRRLRRGRIRGSGIRSRLHETSTRQSPRL